jgi:hypothetical protein
LVLVGFATSTEMLRAPVCANSCRADAAVRLPLLASTAAACARALLQIRTQILLIVGVFGEAVVERRASVYRGTFVKELEQSGRGLE